MFMLFSRNFFFLALLFSFLFLLTPSAQAQGTAFPPVKPDKPTVTRDDQQVTPVSSTSGTVTGRECQQKVDGGSYGTWTAIANSSGN